MNRKQPSYYGILVVIILSAIGTTNECNENLSWNELEKESGNSSAYRLPENVIPTNYDLSIFTRLGVGDFSYDGEVRIDLKVLETTNTIIVHAEKLNIHDELTTLHWPAGNLSWPITIQGQSYDPERQFHIIEFTEELKPDEYTLKLFFTGEIHDDVFGFYRSSYMVDGQTKWIGVTQFSPTYARRAFPCMDEPGLKAEFTIHIGHHGDLTVTGNTPIESTVKIGSQYYYLTTLSPTPRMSTYLVGWAVHNFRMELSDSSENFKMWTRDSMSHCGTFALNQGLAIYSTLEKWMKTDNPIRKMDQFALADFNFNAMENWGMITYRESVVLYEKKITPVRRIFNGLTTMAHEYAHTWFGNLVTPKFWNFAWLKEGFATYFQYFALSLLDPEINSMNLFVVDYLQPTLLVDSANHTRTMNGKNVGSPSSIMGTLDFVTYKKAGSIIRMICHVLGQSVFQEGLHAYLENMSFQAATPSDLYKYLQQALKQSNKSEINIANILESWANQPGYPVVTVIRNYTEKTAWVTQQPFYLDCELSNSNAYKWWIPVNFAEKGSIGKFDETSARYWLTPEDNGTIIASLEPEDWLIFNVQQTGYYRVNYDERNWRLLADHLRLRNITEMHTLNRAALLDDAFNLARAGRVDYSIAFNLSAYLTREQEYEPWLAAINNLSFLNRILSTIPSVHRFFQNYVNELIQPLYETLGFIEDWSDNLRTKLHRELILSAACSINNDNCLKAATTLFGSWIFAPEIMISPHLKSFVYCVGIRSANETTWQTVWNIFLRTDLHTEQELLLDGLGCTKLPHLINTFLDAAISQKQGIRKQYQMIIINAVLNGNPENVIHVVEFIRNNLQKIIDLRGYAFLTKVLKAIGERAIADAELTKQLALLVAENAENLGSSTSAAKEALQLAQRNLKWLEKYSPVIAACLR